MHHLSLLFSVAAANNCVSIASTGVCAPYSGLFIDVERLKLKYGTEITPQSWEQIVIATTTETLARTSQWHDWARCSVANSNTLQYHRTLVCMADLFETSMHCNQHQKDLAPVCRHICHTASDAVGHLVRNPQVCPLDFGFHPQHTYMSVYSHRQKVRQSRKHCERILAHSMFNHEKACTLGLGMDSSTCGFGGNMTEFDSFCENGEANCCAVQSQALTPVSAAAFAPAPQNQRAVDPPCGPYGTCRLQKAAVFLGFAQNAPIGTRESTATGKAALVVIISCMLVALIAALSILFMNYRIKQDNAIEGLERFRGASLRNTHVAVPLSDVEDPADLSMGHARPTSTTGSEDTFEDDPLLPRHEAKFVYLPQNPDEILLEVGDIVTILQKQDDSWAICRNLTKKVTGVIPLAYIQPIEAVVEPAPSDNEILETIPLNQEE